MPRDRPVALTIAGTDSGGGAGVLADCRTFHVHGVWPTAAVVAVTAQDTVGVHAVQALPADLVRAQVDAVARDIGVDAAKTGMLASADLVEAVVEAVAAHGIAPLVVDPVLVSKHGDHLLAPDAVEAVRRRLLPLAALVTPNLPEAEALTGTAVGDRAAMERAARALVDLGAGAALVKGGHLSGDGSPDCLFDGQEVAWLDGPRIAGRHTHGTGCVLSAAVTARLARGEGLSAAVAGAKRFVSAAIAAGVDLGHGVGPVDPGGAGAAAGP